VQTVLIYVLIPAVVYGFIALLTMWPKAVRGPRYRSGQPWTYAPVWWSADSSRLTTTDAETTSVRTARGGARGNW
jgi:hypothetical protein